MLFLRAGMFSSPKRGRETKGDAFAQSVDSTSARLGLFGVVVLRLRGDDRMRSPSVRRTANFCFLVVCGACNPKGDSVKAAIGLVCLSALGLKARDVASGEIGEPGASTLPMRRWNREGFEGDLERERRSCCSEDEKWAG